MLEQTIISISTKMRWATNCAEAVAHLHSRSPPLIHRDLKPQNILLTKGDTPVCKLVSPVCNLYHDYARDRNPNPNPNPKPFPSYA